MEMVSKHLMLEKAIEITKEYTRSGGTGNLETVLERIYDKLKILGEDTSSE